MLYYTLQIFAMTTLTIITTSLKNLRINKRRSLLTMLGLVIGIMSVILVMSAGAGAQSLITNQVKSRGTDQVVVLAGASDSDGPPAQAFGVVITTLTEGDRDALLKKSNVAHISHAAGYTSGNLIMQWGGEERNVTFTGANADYQVIENVTVADGRFFSEAENKEREHVMVLGSGVAREIFGNQNPVGENVKLGKKQFRVIGLLQPQSASIFENVDDSVLIPLQTAQYDLLGIRHVSFIRTKLEGEQYIAQTVQEVKDTLIDRHGEEDFSVRNTAAALDILTNITDALKFFLVAIAGISLFVGGVGIMNIMLISVKEKTREIGLRKAVGAREGDILKQFLIETIVLSVLGGIIGLVLGVLISYVIAKGIQSVGYDYSFIVSIPSVIVSLGIATLIGVVFGVVPARKAARLDPIDALRYE
jgi:ABC-type antimicrobial peptide transport system permease subunit